MNGFRECCRGEIGDHAEPTEQLSGLLRQLILQVSRAPALAGSVGISGTVVDAGPFRLALLLEHPAPGTAFLAVEDTGVSVWSYLYGPDAAAIAARDEPAWRRWLDERAPAAG